MFKFLCTLLGIRGRIIITNDVGDWYIAPLRSEADFRRAKGFCQNYKACGHGKISAVTYKGVCFRTSIVSNRDLEEAVHFFDRELEIVHKYPEALIKD